MTDSFEIIRKSHLFDGKSDKRKSYYAEWAHAYDHDVQAQGYAGPMIMGGLCSLLATAYLGTAPSSLDILDAGCGTGLVGVELNRQGFNTIDGFDLSSHMIALASERDVYRELRADVDLNNIDELPLNRQYDIVLSCGVYTLGHVRPDTVALFGSVLRPGGFFVLSTRDSYMKESNFRDSACEVLKKCRMEPLFSIPEARYVDEEPAHYWVFRALHS